MVWGEVRGVGELPTASQEVPSCLSVEGLAGFSCKNQLHVLPSQKPFLIPLRGAYSTPCAFSVIAFITWSGMCLFVLQEGVCDGRGIS